MAPITTSHHDVLDARNSPAAPATKNDGEGRVAHPRRGDELRRRQAKRTDAHGVGAADAVGVVVGVVRAHLQRERHEETERELPQPIVRGRTSATPTTTGTMAAGNVRGRAASSHRRSGPGASVMDAWETSRSPALRCSTKALRPS